MNNEYKQLTEDIKYLIELTLKSSAKSGLSDYLKYILSLRNPIDYMRYAEFTAINKMIDLKPGKKILDVASPQWYTLYKAWKYPECTFVYLNIIDEELEAYREIKELLSLKNLSYVKGDVRKLEYEQGTFDYVLSLSVIEHIYPELDGDVAAFNEIKRVLKPEGELLMTVPYKEKSNIVYLDEKVFERESQQKNFFAREYDRSTYNKLLAETGYHALKQTYICEKKGLFSPDYYLWGQGKESKYAKFVQRLQNSLAARNIIEQPDEFWATQYLFLSDKERYRLVNIAACLKPMA